MSLEASEVKGTSDFFFPPEFGFSKFIILAKVARIILFAFITLLIDTDLQPSLEFFCYGAVLVSHGRRLRLLIQVLVLSRSFLGGIQRESKESLFKQFLVLLFYLVSGLVISYSRVQKSLCRNYSNRY